MLSQRRYKRDQGFTLLEVLIALVILATALTALVLVVIEANNQTSYLTDKTAAHWVAMNVLAEVRLGLIPIDSVNVEQEGESPIFNKTWRWQAQATATADNKILAVTVKVGNIRSKPIASMRGFVRDAAG